MSTRPKRRTAAALTVAVTLGAAGCGGSDKHVNEARPATPVVLSASITPQRVTVSPETIGAGPVSLLIANVTSRKQQITLQSEDSPGAGITSGQRRSGTIAPAETATLKVDLKSGRYSVRVEDEEIAPADFNVGKPRASAQDDLLLP